MRPFEWLPSLIAALSAFALGGLWYSPLLFGKAWQRESGLTDEQLAAANKLKIFGISFLLCLVGLAWVATSFGVNYLFELKSLKLWLINAGYHTMQFTLYGLIFGLL
jgi:hypothetical protein